MASYMEEAKQKVIKVVQELLLEEEDRSTITPKLISEKIDNVIKMSPKWGNGLDREAVTDELIRRFSLWIGKDSKLVSNEGHMPWLNAARKKDWRYWQRYREWLEGRVSYRAVDALDQSTNTILGLLEDPERAGPWDRRGLVVGHVQSGKTSNYIGLISKAADAGYKIIIVLAGLHNNLRSQTQMRLDEGFLGYKTSNVPDDTRIIGVGEIDGDPSIRPNFATNRSNNGDFNTKVASNLGITPEQRPWLFVVKKNKTVLERLYGWIQNHVANLHDPDTGRKIVTNLPLLLIDDEADHASIDTGEQTFDAEGNPDEEHLPKTINRLIRRILGAFTRSACVGYTATPFANIFVHERGETREEGMDLFPAAFIINLAAPSNYVGPAQVFGLHSIDSREGELPLKREINDHSILDGLGGWMPHKHKNGHQPLFEGRSVIPDSLREAIDTFTLSCAVRQLRGQGHDHSSMLVHVTRFISVQKCVHDQVDENLRQMRQRLQRKINHEPVLARLRSIWDNDFCITNTQIREQHPEFSIPLGPAWEEIEAVLPDIISDIDVRMINGTAKDALDYSEHDGNGLKVIAIGGDKLSRGLTLEGLCVSYFLRASRMYDTLMQMGRWFGYRPGYLDLCRLYTTPELMEWFSHIADASEELREEFDLMAESGGTPRDYGLKVQSHPSLMVTSRVKMRTAKTLMLSFSGQVLETISLFRNPDKLSLNYKATIRFVAGLGEFEEDPARSWAKWKGYLWKDVPTHSVIDFLLGYSTHPDAYKVNTSLLIEFIQSMSQIGELTEWTVALLGGGEGGKQKITDRVEVNMLKRAAKTNQEDRYSIGRLLSPRDESIDLTVQEWKASLELTRKTWNSDPARLQSEADPVQPSGPSIRKVRGGSIENVPGSRERGLLLLYVLDPDLAKAGFQKGTPPVIAFGISFPGSDSGLRVEYKVNNLLWEQEYGAAE